MFDIYIRMQYGKNFSGELHYNKINIGGVGLDNEGIYVNLNKRLPLEGTFILMEYLCDYFEEALTQEIKIQYTEDHID